MKFTIPLTFLLTCACASGATLAQRYEAAYRLETENQKPDEAAAIYRELVATDTTGEDRLAIIQAAKRLIALYQQEAPQTMEEKIEALMNAPTIVDHVVETFGEPLAYTGRDEVYDKDGLPYIFSMDYPHGFSVHIFGGKISTLNFGFTEPTYIIHGLHIGSKKAEVFKIFPPDRIERDTGQKRTAGIVYTSRRGTESSNYGTTHGINFFFAKDWVFQMGIKDLEQVRAYTPPTKQEVVK
jgi:hypothetical protein